MCMKAKALIGKPGDHPYGNTTKQVTFAAAEAGVSTMYCTSFSDEQNKTLWKISFIKRLLVEVSLMMKLHKLYFGSRVCSVTYQIKATEFSKQRSSLHLFNVLLKI